MCYVGDSPRYFGVKRRQLGWECRLVRLTGTRRVVAAGGVTNVVGLVLIPHMISELVVTVKRLFACCAAKQRYVCTRLRLPVTMCLFIALTPCVNWRNASLSWWRSTTGIRQSIHKHTQVCTLYYLYTSCDERQNCCFSSLRAYVFVYLPVCSETEKLPPIINWLTSVTC